MKRKLKLYYTTDTHGYLFPTDYISKKQKDMGVLSCNAAYEKDGNTLILDAGDTIQGSAFVKYMWEKDKKATLIAEAFNEGKYDYITLGNHDFNNGYEALYSYIKASKAECIVANVKDTKGELNLKPYVIHTLENGLKVGIVGLVTDYVTLWEKEEHLEYFEIEDTFTAAKRTLDLIKNQCDVTVALYHGGFECNLETGEKLVQGKENVGYKICKELDFDILLTGHQHMKIQGQMIEGTYTMQLLPNAQQYGYVEVLVDEQGELEIDAKSIAPKAIEEDKIAATFKERQQKVQAWLDQKLGSFNEVIEPLSKLELALKGSRLADFCNQVQLELTGADFSCTGLGNNLVGFDKEVTMREVIAAYAFPNTIKVLAIDKATLKLALERAAEYFTLKNGEVQISECFIYPKVEHYNYDFFAGLSYSFDITKPIGQRVVEMKIDGKDLEDKMYTIAMSDYRATGTGGYDCYKTCDIVKEYAVDIQEVVIEYIQSKGCVNIMEKPHFCIKI